MRRIFAAAAIATLLLSCEPPIRHIVTLTFNEAADLVTLSASTILSSAKPGTPEAAQIADEREALLNGQDEWSVRFANADPESDRMVLQRTHGELQSLERVATIAPENLQKFFFDTHLTVTFTRSEGWAELTIYPGTSDRATRQQRENVDRLLGLYADRAARYFQAVRGMYAYLDQKPRRAEDLFKAMMRDDDKDPPARVSEDELKLANGVRDALDNLVSGDLDTSTLQRDFDAVYNPFPAELKVFLHGNILASEGFTQMPDRTVIVKLPELTEAVAMLEGRWITPDPLAVALRSPDGKTSDEIALALAAAPRHTEPVVTSSDIAAALLDKMRPAPRYRVRWIVKATPSPR